MDHLSSITRMDALYKGYSWMRVGGLSHVAPPSENLGVKVCWKMQWGLTLEIEGDGHRLKVGSRAGWGKSGQRVAWIEKVRGLQTETWGLREKQLGFLNSSLVILAKTGLYHQELKSSLIKALFKSYPHPLRLNHLDLRHHLGPRAHFLTDPTRIFNHYKSITVGSIQQ
jgi:hypothetical protein